ncbi:MAG: UDP-N-acetylglucosamine 2-epimerase, partial [Lachnospiraceae bacterium]|nr:UDP-N-acetylglucosamine 2-epimerase [Lachnospiraceae bacterium]
MVVGNSSSGIIEVPSFKIPTVNIGNRQLGRVKADSVIDCGESTLEIVEAIKRAKALYEGNGLYNMKNPYEGVCPSESILYEIRKFLSEGSSTIKSFYSIV